MQEVIELSTGAAVDEGLASLEVAFPDIRDDYNQLRALIRANPFGVGVRLDPADNVLADVSWEYIHHTSSGQKGRYAVALVFEVWRDSSRIAIEYCAVYAGWDWHDWSREKRCEVARRLVAPAE
jgi:hypothetical protein